MFFKNIDTYSNKKLFILNFFFNFVYFIFLVVCPIITISIKYKIFEKVPEHIRLTGIGLILFILVGLYIYLKLKEIVEKLPQNKSRQQKLKFTLRMIINIIPFFLIILALSMTNDTIDIAFDTFRYCIIFFLVSIIIKGLFLDYLEAEKEIRNKAQELIEIDKRKIVLKEK